MELNLTQIRRTSSSLHQHVVTEHERFTRCGQQCTQRSSQLRPSSGLPILLITKGTTRTAWDEIHHLCIDHQGLIKSAQCIISHPPSPTP